MIERFLKQTKFTSEQDFKEHLEFIIPEDFNFAYDVMDEWAKIKPDHVALLWTSERGEEIRFTYKDLKEQSDKAAAYFHSPPLSQKVLPSCSQTGTWCRRLPWQWRSAFSHIAEY